MNNDIYQVVVSDKAHQTVIHVGYFRLHAFAMDCMRELSKTVSKDQTICVWQNTLFEGQWDGNVNVREDLARDLTYDNKNS